VGEGAVVEPAVDFAREEEVEFVQERFDEAGDEANGECECRAVRALVEGVVPGALAVSYEYDGFLFDGGVDVAVVVVLVGAGFDDWCEDCGGVRLFGPCFVVAEEEVGDSLHCQSKLVDDR